MTLWTWAIAVAVVFGVYRLGQWRAEQASHVGMEEMAERYAKEATFKKLKKLDEEGRNGECHDLAQEMVLAELFEEDREGASKLLARYREKLPKAMLRLMWEEKVRG